jgi:hypothetical protein
VLTVPGLRRRIFSPHGWVSPVILVDGRIAGVWTHTRRGGTLSVAIEPFAKLPAWARLQLEAEAARLAAFLDCSLAEMKASGR